MTTLATLKTRIANELARDDLTSEIALAINDAIAAYENRRFFYNEGRSYTFQTVAAQEFYDSDDLAALGRLIKIDYVVLYIGDQGYHLVPMKPADIETASNGTNTGQPGWYCWYGNALRLYPSPAEAWIVRVAGVFEAAAPATDGETGNPWMTKGERLIRSRAKLELALHVIRNDELAGRMNIAVTEALEQLEVRTNQLVGNDIIEPMEF